MQICNDDTLAKR